MKIKKLIIELVHGLIGWFLCAATMGIGISITTIRTTLIIHAIGAPIYFAIISLFYFKRYNYTGPLQTAIIFISFVMIVDFLVVALLINRSLAMFASALGTWIPFGLIFTSTLLTGLVVRATMKRAKT